MNSISFSWLIHIKSVSLLHVKHIWRNVRFSFPCFEKENSYKKNKNNQKVKILKTSKFIKFILALFSRK